LTAIIYAAGNEPVVEIMNNNIEMFSIDALFQKQFRLKTMKTWDETTFKEHLGQKTDWSMLCGRKYSGTDIVGGLVSKLTSGKIISMEKIEEEVTKKRLSPEDAEEPMEGPAPAEEVEKDDKPAAGEGELVQNTIAANRTSQKFILLEGLCNSNKLESEEQRLELRFMDEFFAIEKGIGEVFAVVSLQFK